MIVWSIILGLFVVAIFYARDTFFALTSASTIPESKLSNQEKRVEDSDISTTTTTRTQRQHSNDTSAKSTSKIPRLSKKEKETGLKQISCENTFPKSNPRSGSNQSKDKDNGIKMSELSDDDLLDAACDDLDDMLDLAADDLIDEGLDERSAGNVVVTKKSSYVVPKVWQEALNVLDPKEKIQWAGIIQADISKQAKQDHGYRIYSKAYKSGREVSKASKNRKSPTMSVTGVFNYILKRSMDSYGMSNKDLLEKLLEDNELRLLFKQQITRDLSTRLKSVPSDLENVKAEPTRFPNCAKVMW